MRKTENQFGSKNWEGKFFSWVPTESINNDWFLNSNEINVLSLIIVSYRRLKKGLENWKTFKSLNKFTDYISNLLRFEEKCVYIFSDQTKRILFGKQ